MGSRFSNRNKRCLNCRISPALCFCDSLIKKECHTPVKIIMHKAEQTLTTNSAYFAQKMLENCEILVRGLKDSPLEVGSHIDFKNFTPLYLFPDEDSVELTSEFLSTLKLPPQLIVPDGSWKQAKKFKRREPSLSKIQSVRLSSDLNSIYRLRTAPAPGAVCTYEAIAAALGMCEGKKLEKELLDVFKTITDRMFHSRKGIVDLKQLEKVLNKE